MQMELCREQNQALQLDRYKKTQKPEEYQKGCFCKELAKALAQNKSGLSLTFQSSGVHLKEIWTNWKTTERAPAYFT